MVVVLDFAYPWTEGELQNIHTADGENGPNTNLRNEKNVQKGYEILQNTQTNLKKRPKFKFYACLTVDSRLGENVKSKKRVCSRFLATFAPYKIATNLKK